MKRLLLAFFIFLFYGAHAQPFEKGQKVDVYGQDGKYYSAVVTDVANNQYKISYEGYGRENDVWVNESVLFKAGKKGDRIIVVDKNGSVFYGTIETVLPGQYKVKYDGYTELYTLIRSQFHFVNNTSSATTPVTTSPVSSSTTNSTTTQTISTNATASTSIAVGSTIEALQGSRWYVATIKEIKDGKYLVAYQGYNEEEWVTPDRLRKQATLPADKLRGTTGKVYIRSIRWIATGYTELTWLYLGDNGVIVWNPLHGVNPVDLAAEQVDNYKNVGLYTIQGGQIAIKWLNGTTTNLSLRYSNGELIEMDAGGIMVRQTGLSDNYKLSGTYSGSTSFGNVAGSATYTFKNDGTVAVTKAGYVNTPDASGNNQNSKQGVYSIKGNTLTIAYNNGTKETCTIGVFNGPGNQKLVINSAWLSQQ